MRLILLTYTGILFVSLSCNTSTALFSGKSPHERYAEKISDAGLKGTALGKKWFAAAETAFEKAAAISLPYRVVGYFPADKPAAFAFKFKPARGEKLIFQLTKRSVQNFEIFCDLWQLNSATDPKYLRSMDTTTSIFEFEVFSEDSLLLRLQPELLSSGEYTLAISTAPSLAFPVAKNGARIASFWGASREAGARTHEGIDIFAPRGTPAVAAANGYIGSVTVNNLGGNVVFMKPDGKDFSLYYAHLDTQLVKTGQRVKSGDTIGTIGNTGNARTTPPHLHFGIYTSGGAINPLPFVDPGIKTPKLFTVESGLFTQPAVLSTSVEVSEKNYSKGTPVSVVAASTKNFTVLFPDGVVATPPRSAIKDATVTLAHLKAEQYIYEIPDTTAPRILQLDRNRPVQTMGSFNNFVLVRVGDTLMGWTPSDGLR